MAVRFDAVGDTADRTANLPGNTAFTYLLWAVMDTDQGSGVSQPIMAFLNGASTEGVIFAHTANILRIEVYDGGVLINSADTASRPALGTPAAFFLRCSGTGANLLTGGFRSAGSNSFVTTSTTLPATVDAPATLYLGGLLGAFYYNGRRWNVKVWDRALSDAELLAESYYERVMYPASLNLYYPWTGSTDTADRSGNARNPTIGGTLTTGDTPVQLLQPSRKIIVPQVAGAQTLSPPLVTRTRTVYAPTVTVGAVSLSPPLVTRTRTVYAPTVTTSNTLSPPLVTRTHAVYSPTITVGDVNLSPPLVTRTRAVYAPTVTQPGGGDQTLSPPLVTRTRVVYEPVVVPGEVDVLPPLVTRTRTVYAPTVTTSITISPPLVTRGRVVYAPTVTVGAVTLFPPLVTRSRAVYAPTVTGGDPVVATGGLFLPIVRRRRR